MFDPELRKARRPSRAPQPIDQWDEEPRIDGRDKVTGATKYLADLPQLQGEGRVVMVRSPYAHARILSVDSSSAADLPGVWAILDRNNLDDIDIAAPISEYLNEGGHGGDAATVGGKHLIATDKARYDGDIVAMVAAADLETAVRAAELIDIRYEPLPEVFSFRDAMAEGAPIIHDGLGSNLAVEDLFEWGDVDRGFEQADVVVEASYYGGNVFHHPMEPSTPGLVRVTDDEADVWTSSHKPFLVADHLERVLGINREDVRVRIPPIGGGFGAKQITPEIIGTAALARRTRRPLRFIATEEDAFRTTTRHAIEYRGKIGLKSDGSIVALDVELDVDTGAYFTGAALVAHNACISAWGCYRIPHFRVKARAAFTNKTPAGSFRATGKNQTTFAIESLLDEAAKALSLHPVAIRRRNALKRGEYVADIWRVRGVEGMADIPAMDTDYDQLIDAALSGIGWAPNEGEDLYGNASENNGRFVRGRGLALSLRHGAQGGGRAHALVELDQNGVFTVRHNAPDLGSGVYTMIAVTCAQSMGVPVSQVRVTDPDTSNLLPFGGTSAQRTTVQMGNAVRAACDTLKDEILDAATQVRGGGLAEWSISDGRLWKGEDESYSFREIMSLFKKGVSLRAVGAYSYAPSEDKAFGGLDHWAPGAGAVEVEVDTETGHVRLLSLCLVADAGKAIHTTSAVRQVEGGAILGIGGAMFEDMIYEDGMLKNGHVVDYRMPLMSDMPSRFETVLIENADGPGPFGSKGMSQTSLPCVAPAIANAIEDATGIRIRVTPLTPERVFRALEGTP